MIFFNVCSLVPDAPSSVPSWREYFYAVRRSYFLGMLLWGLVITVSTRVSLDLPWGHPARIGHATFAVAGVLGASTANESIHHAIPVVVALMLFLEFVLLGFQPAPLAQ